MGADLWEQLNLTMLGLVKLLNNTATQSPTLLEPRTLANCR
jgi:hypothetical protein